MNKFVKQTMQAPVKPQNIPENAEWLAGEGAGSWFYIKTLEDDFFISRFSPEGKLECEGAFRCANATNFSISTSFNFTHLSHCKTVNIVQSGFIFKFERL